MHPKQTGRAVYWINSDGTEFHACSHWMLCRVKLSIYLSIYHLSCLISHCGSISRRISISWLLNCCHLDSISAVLCAHQVSAAKTFAGIASHQGRIGNRLLLLSEKNLHHHNLTFTGVIVDEKALQTVKLMIGKTSRGISSPRPVGRSKSIHSLPRQIYS
jgi:hypothetical protein